MPVKNATKNISMASKQHSLYTAVNRLLVMIQAEIKQFVIRFSSVECIILEILVPHYLSLAKWGVSLRLSQHIQDSICNAVILRCPNFYTSLHEDTVIYLCWL